MGKNVRVWHDKWVPKDQNIIALTPGPANDPNLLVSELIYFDNACWDSDVLAQQFDEYIIAAILTVPLSYRWPTDSLYWFIN